MKTMIHNLSKRTKSALAVLLALVMVFGIVAVITPVEAQAVEIQATDAGFYSLAYGTDGITTFDEGTQIRVINQTLADKGKNKSDAVYTTDGASWAPVDASNYLVWDGTGENTFYGVYPATAGYNDFTLPIDQTGGVQDADWMTATYTGAKGDGFVNFHMQHLLSKVTVNLKFASQYDGEPTISDVSFPISGAQLYANYLNDGSTTISINSNEKPSVLPHQDSEMCYTAILPSCLYSADKPFINLTVNGEDHLTALAGNNNTLASFGLQPGKHYTFDLTVGKDVVTLSTVSVEGWVDGGIIDGGVAEEVCYDDNSHAPTGEIDYVWSDDGSTCTATQVCSRCSDGYSETATSTYADGAYTVYFADALFGTASMTVYTLEDEFIYFGEYPQTKKDNSVVISQTQNEKGYYLGSDDAWYAEVSGGYYKVEPIKWKILSRTGDTVLVISDKILTKRSYSYSNTYRSSSVRYWLNNTLYNDMFSSVQQGFVLTTTVDNSAASTGNANNQYACSNTDDKVFLLSYADVTNGTYGFWGSAGSDPSRQKSKTDYAGAVGSSSEWWLRSPSVNSSTFVLCVSARGTVTLGSDYESGQYENGIVPALTIKLK